MQFGTGIVNKNYEIFRLEVVYADSYVKFNCDRRTAQLVCRARAALDAVLAAKVARPDPTSGSEEAAIISIIVKLLETELEGGQEDYEEDE